MKIRDPHAQRYSIREMSRRPRLARNTVKKYLAAAAAGITLNGDLRSVCAAGRALMPRSKSRRSVKVYACPGQNKRAAPWPTPCAQAEKLVSVNFRGTRHDRIDRPYRSPECHVVYGQRAYSLWQTGRVKAACHRRRYA